MAYDKIKPYKSLKQLCKEAGLKPIPFEPVTRSLTRNIRKREANRYHTVWVCYRCKWEGKKYELKRHEANGPRHCPVCDAHGRGIIVMMRVKNEEKPT